MGNITNTISQIFHELFFGKDENCFIYLLNKIQKELSFNGLYGIHNQYHFIKMSLYQNQKFLTLIISEVSITYWNRRNGF